LAVAGVLPLLWNMLVAIRIWTKLKRSIPPSFMNYYSLIPDPTAGNVTVVARMPTLDIPGLWSINTPKARLRSSASEKKKKPYSQLHRSIVAMGMPLTAPSTAMMARDASRSNIGPPPSPLRIERQKLLGRTWMSLADHCGLVLKKSRNDEDENDDDPSDQEEIRFLVASDMKASDRTPLEMNWVQFVWLALALGVNPSNPSWQPKFPYYLKDSEEEDFVHLFYEEDRLFAKCALRAKLTYSLRRAFAYYNIELDNECLSPLGCDKSARVCLEHVTMSPELSRCRLGMDLNSQGCSNTIRGKEPQDCNNPLAAACCWMLYWRRHYHEFHELLPVSQHLLEYRQRVLCRLNLLDDENMLVAKVRSLLLANSVDEVATKHQSDLDDASNTTQTTSEPTLPHLDPSQDIPMKTEMTESKQPVEDALLNAHQQSQAEAILKQLRSRFAASKYVQMHINLCKHAEFIKKDPLLRAVLEKRELTQGEKMRMIINRKHDIRLELNEPLWSVLEPQDRKSTKSRNERDLYSLFPSRMKAEFESKVQSWASDPEVQGGSRWDEMEGTGLLACIALALTDWDCYESKAWRSCDDLAITFNQTNRLVKNLIHGARSVKDFGKVDDAYNLERLFARFTTGILENGLFTAPSENPVSPLFQLREKDAKVYLL
jgi:hypothetical protein